MSAIAGIINLENSSPIGNETLVSMLEAMRPATNCDIETYTILEHRAVMGRLAYGSDEDCKTRQDKRGTSCHVFFVGELYNDEVSLYYSSANYLLDRYLRLGVESFADGLNGSFSAAIADSKNGSVTLITDHTASCPLFTAIDGGKLYFASEIKGIMAVEQLRREPETSAVISLVARGFFVRGRTLMEGVWEMDYATVCHIRDGQVQSRPYWRYIIEPSADKGYKKYLEEFAWLLRQAVKRRTRKGRVAIMLSGGIDSRGILCCLDEPSKVPAVTYTGRTHQTRHKLGDWALAERITEKLGMDLSVVHYDGREFIRAMQESVYASDGAAGFVFENIWEDIRQATGAEYLLAGDECMGWAGGPMSGTQVLPSIGINSLESLNELQGCMRQDRLGSFIEVSARDIEGIDASCRIKVPCDRVDQLYFEQRLTHFLMPKRRIISKHGLFVRDPWLDLDILNFVRKLPTLHRVRKSLFRKTIRHINPSLCRLPRAREPETINYQGYLSEAEKKRQTVSKMVFEDNPFFEEFFDISRVRKLIEEICCLDVAVTPKQRFDPMTLLPMSIRTKLRSYVYWLKEPTPKLSGVNLVLRIAMVATAMRHLSNPKRLQAES